MNKEINHIYADVDGCVNVRVNNKDYINLLVFLIRSISETLANNLNIEKNDIIHDIITKIINEAYKGGDESE